MDPDWDRWEAEVTTENLYQGMVVKAVHHSLHYKNQDWNLLYIKFFSTFDGTEIEAGVDNTVFPTHYANVTQGLVIHVRYRLRKNWQQLQVFDKTNLTTYLDYPWVAIYNAVVLDSADEVLHPIFWPTYENIQFYPTVRMDKQLDCQQITQRYCRAQFSLDLP